MSPSTEKKPTKKPWFRRADLFLLIGIAVLSAALFAFFFWKDTRINSPMLEITSGGKTIGVYPLDEDREIRIGDESHYNLCRIENGTVRMTEADCPDRSCVRSLAIDRRGGQIICLPHRVVLRIIDGTGGLPDAVAE